MVHYVLQQSVPMRHKEFHIINVPSALKYIVDFAVSKVTPKMAERLNVSTYLKSPKAIFSDKLS